VGLFVLAVSSLACGPSTVTEPTGEAVEPTGSSEGGGEAAAAPHRSFDESLQMVDVDVVEVPVDADAAARRLSKAITFRTVSNQDRADFDENAFRQFHRYLQRTFPRAHATLHREILGEPRAFTLLYTWTGQEPSLPPIVLMAHQDVVPVVPGTEQEWTHDAYSGDVADGYVWGRGTLDDKVVIMAIFEAVEILLQQGFTPRRTILLLLGQDEEVGGQEGVHTVSEMLRARGTTEVALVLDEGLPLTTGLFPGVAAPTALIGAAEKGYVSVELRVEAPGGHSAMPPPQSNIGVLARAVTRLEDEPFPDRIIPLVREELRFLGPVLPPEDQPFMADVAYGGDEEGRGTPAESERLFFEWMNENPLTRAFLHTTTAVTMFNGGVKENVLPPSASAVVNFRILQGDTVASVIERVRGVVADDRVQVRGISSSNDPSPVSPTGDEYRLIERSIRQTWGTPDLIVSPTLMIGGTDSKWLAATIAPNVYRFTPVRVESAADAARWHGVDERVLVSEYARSIGFFHHFIENAQGL